MAALKRRRNGRLSRLGWAEVETAFNDAVERGVIPGATVVVRHGDEVAFEGAFGFRSLVPDRSPMKIDTVFDLSSLTKALCTTTAVMMLARDGKLRLDDRVTRFFHNFGVHGKNAVTFRQLLAHCSGLAAWRPFYQRVAEIEKTGSKVNFMASFGAKEFVYEEIHREKPEAPPGTKTIYSDLNFILLGETVEKLASVPFNRFCRDKVFRPLGLRATDFVDISMVRSRRLEPVAEMFAPTEVCPSRKRLLVGEVDDENCYAMGGVAGHAGLFAPVREVDRIARELMAAWAGKSDYVPQRIIREFWTRDTRIPGSTWALGWDTPSPEASSSGHHFSSVAVGHLGFTGTSIWIEPARAISVSLLTNRVHPRRDNQAIREFRPRIHDLIMEAIGGE
jgi:CubicO group peptidase (beta-lactamase class C family)